MTATAWAFHALTPRARAPLGCKPHASPCRFTRDLYSGLALDGPLRSVVLRASVQSSSEPDMLLQIYSPQCAPWLIIDGQPSCQAVASYGALRLEGSFQVGRLTESERRVVLREMATLSYARVPAATARRLMALSPIRKMKRRLTRWLPAPHDPPFRA